MDAKERKPSLTEDELSDIYNALTFKAERDRRAAELLKDPESGIVPENARGFYEQLLVQADRQEKLADALDEKFGSALVDGCD